MLLHRQKVYRRNNRGQITFSCDGSHYMPYDEFLRMDSAFWIGSSEVMGPGLVSKS
jgi:hypothetical protein